MTRPPAGYMHARDAINAVGRALFPDKWTGDEGDKKHRSLLPPGFRTRHNAFEPIPSGRRAPRVGRREDTHVVTSAPDTLEYRERYKAAQEAQRRWAQTLDTILDRIASGAARACVVDPSSGRDHPLPSHWVRRSDAHKMLADGKEPVPQTQRPGDLYLSESVVPEPPLKRPLLPRSELPKIVQRLRERPELNREEQRALIAQEWPDHHIRDADYREAFRQLPRKPGRQASKRGAKSGG